MAHEIRMAGDEDFFGWLPLFEAYCRFYETDLDDAKALIVWNWVRDEHDPLEAALAVDEDGTPVALAQYRVVPHTLQATRGLYLDDLYVPRELSEETAAQVRGLRAWRTDEYEHNGLRADGARILGRLLDLARGRA